MMVDLNDAVRGSVLDNKNITIKSNYARHMIDI